MSKFLIRILSFVVVFSSLSACKTQQKATSPVVTDIKPMVNKSVQELQDKLDSASFNLNYLTAKASVVLIQDSNEISFNISYRSKKDSVIWISVSPLLGIEVARLMITEDTVKLLDKIHNKYEVTSFESINKLLQMKVNF